MYFAQRSFFHTSTALVVLGILIVKVSRSHSDTPRSVRFLCKSDRPIVKTYTGKHTTQATDIYGPGGIRTRNPSKRATADPRLELRMNSPNYNKFA